VLRYAIAISFLLTLAGYDAAHAVPADLAAMGVQSSTTDVQLARFAARGPHGGVAVGGPRGVAVRGPNGGGYVRGGRYYGGVWYGTGRRYWNGRWWPYGVGSCWSASPIGYVWVCG
jgi:hypothetical protein